MTLLGGPLHSLTAAEVQAFLDGADSEPLLWEAKGRSLDRHSVRKEVCGFANGRQPGYLILGAEESDEGWTLGGFDFAGDPPAWISAVVADGLRPVPLIDVVTIRLDDDRHLAVVEVSPVAIAPCICRGTVYERVSGRTIPVKEPIRLAELYKRGDAAHALARAGAESAADELMRDPRLPGAEDRMPRISLALAATGHPDDIASRLFSQRYEAALGEVVGVELVPAGPARPPDPFGPRVVMGFEQSNRYVDCNDLHTYAHRRDWHVRAIWDGTVAVYADWAVDRVAPEQIAEELIGPAWRAAHRLVSELGGYGPTHTEIRVDGGRSLLGREGRPLGAIRVGRGPLEAAPTPQQLAGIERELRRACGQSVYEDPIGTEDETEA